MKLSKKSKSVLVSAAFSALFGLLMTFWGMGRYSEDKLVSFLLYTVMFFILHRAMSSKWK